MFDCQTYCQGLLDLLNEYTIFECEEILRELGVTIVDVYQTGIRSYMASATYTFWGDIIDYDGKMEINSKVGKGRSVSRKTSSVLLCNRNSSYKIPNKI